MIIDTEKLKQAVEDYEEKLLKDRYQDDWETCPMSFLNISESRQLKRIDLIEQVEQLNNELSSLLVSTGG